MYRQDLLDLLAAVFLVCVTFVAVVDACTELRVRYFLEIKWSLSWYVARYIGIVCGILLAIDTLAN